MKPDFEENAFPPGLRRWSRDRDGNSIVERAADLAGEPRDFWAPRCPDGYPQKLRHALGFRERNVGELELRVALGGSDLGACHVMVDERSDSVYVRVLVCYEDEPGAGAERSEELDCPVRVWLARPLGDRAVIDFDNDEELPLFSPLYRNNVRQGDHGYRVVHRRRGQPARD